MRLSLHMLSIKLGLLLASSLVMSQGLWSASSPPSLDRIVIVSRHGDRAPLNQYPWDGAVPKRVWKHGYGHLTNHGKQRMYRLGVFLRHRYSRLFKNRNIRPRDLYIRSSDVDRCLETAQLMAAGLSPPMRHWTWNANLGTSWHPVAVHTMPREQDGLLVPSSECNRAYALYGRIPENPRVRHFMIPYESTLREIANLTQVPIRTYREARQVFDWLLCARHHLADDILPNFPLFKAQAWANKEYYQALKAVFEMGFQFDFTGTVEPELRRLRGGLLLAEILKQLDPNVKRESKITLFTTHDTALFHLMDAMGLKPERTPKFGATLLFEAHYSTAQNETSVQLYHIEVKKCNDYFMAKPLHIPLSDSEAGFATTLGAMKRFYAPLLINSLDQWKTECADLRGLNAKQLQRGKDEL